MRKYHQIDVYIYQCDLADFDMEFMSCRCLPDVVSLELFHIDIRNSYTMGCPPVRGDNPRALASGLSNVQVDKHGITILYHLHQCRPCTS